MQIKCEYCGSMISDRAEKCPNCGATNENMKRDAGNTPKTIEELKKWYADRNLPPYSTTRFFIGENYKGAKAFGIYEENGEFIVYKNKADGSRAIRYQGTDEAYAVNELLLKLKSEILNQKSGNSISKKGSSESITDKIKIWLWIIGIIVGTGVMVRYNILWGALASLGVGLVAGLIIWVVLRGIIKKFGKGLSEKNDSRMLGVLILGIFAICLAFTIKVSGATYYNYNNNVYAEYQGSYYQYDGNGDYYYIDALPMEIQVNPADYEYGWGANNWDSSMSFSNSQYFEDNFSWDGGSSDSSYDWDSGSDWSSDSTDWGSDW